MNKGLIPLQCTLSTSVPRDLDRGRYLKQFQKTEDYFMFMALSFPTAHFLWLQVNQLEMIPLYTWGIGLCTSLETVKEKA